MEFEVKIEYSYQECVALWAVVMKNAPDFESNIRRVMLISMGLLFIEVCSYILSLGELYNLWTKIALVLLVLSFVLGNSHVFGLLIFVFLKYTGMDYEEIIFSSDHIAYHTRKRTFLFPYESVISISVMEQQYYLRMDQKTTMFLPPSAFTVGSPDAFADFIQQKTGLTIQYLK